MNPDEKPQVGLRSTGNGFTLVEVLIVIVIIGIVASVAVFATRTITDRGERASCSTDRTTLETAVEAYLAESSATAIPSSGVGVNRYERALVDAGFLQEASTLHDLAANGAVTTSGPPCP